MLRQTRSFDAKRKPIALRVLLWDCKSVATAVHATETPATEALATEERMSASNEKLETRIVRFSVTIEVLGDCSIPQV